MQNYIDQKRNRTADACQTVAYGMGVLRNSSRAIDSRNQFFFAEIRKSSHQYGHVLIPLVGLKLV